MTEHRIEDDLAADEIDHGPDFDPTPAPRYLADLFEQGLAALEAFVAERAAFLDFLNARGEEFPI